jgi:hypothetical protein
MGIHWLAKTLAEILFLRVIPSSHDHKSSEEGGLLHRPQLRQVLLHEFVPISSFFNQFNCL